MAKTTSSSVSEPLVALAVGDEAPDFTAETDAGEAVQLSKLRGQKVILYFYPRDNTPGCTVEACDFRDHHADFKQREVVVLGVSPDSVKSHAGFKAKHSLGFTLIADPEKAISHAYGVFKEKTMYGKKVMGIERTTFVIGADGKIAHVFGKVRVPNHVERVIEALG
jgi:peroxiredoxin Q/BCP